MLNNSITTDLTSEVGTRGYPLKLPNEKMWCETDWFSFYFGRVIL